MLRAVVPLIGIAGAAHAAVGLPIGKTVLLARDHTNASVVHAKASAILALPALSITRAEGRLVSADRLSAVAQGRPDLAAAAPDSAFTLCCWAVIIGQAEALGIGAIC